MTRTKGWAVAFYVVAAVAVATVAVTVDRWILREELISEWADPRAMRTRLANDLQLDSAQRVQLDSILDTRNRSFEALMAPTRAARDSVSAAARQHIRDLLTPEQQTIYDKLQAEREAARQKERTQ